MHIYIYDDYTGVKKYYNLLAQIETRLTDLGLNGKIIRLDVMKNIQDVIENEVKRGAKTIVAVGNDLTVSRIINAIIKIEVRWQTKIETPLGIIPISDKNNFISTGLGIKTGEEACDILSARRIEKLDIGQANNNYFISRAEINAQGTILEMNKNYSIEITQPGEIKIINMNFDTTNKRSNPQDGKLELFINSKTNKKITSFKTNTNQSFFSIKKINIINKNTPLLIDNLIEIQPPVEINVLKKKLNIIVGKERNF